MNVKRDTKEPSGHEPKKLNIAKLYLEIMGSRTDSLEN